MTRGMIFWCNGKLTLLRDNGNGKLESGNISDYDDLYKDLGDNRAEIVEADINELTNLVILNSIDCMSFYKYNKICSAQEAILHALKNEPETLVKIICEENNNDKPN